MSRYRPDNWEKPRGHHEHFTNAELEAIGKGLRDGIPAKDMARKLKCTTRSVQIRYRQLRGETTQHFRYRKAAPRPKAPPADRASRHYKSNFEL